MTERLFGTDGIRGRVNHGAIRPHMFLRFGEALGKVVRQSHSQPSVLIGRDTRASGLMIQSAIESGLINAGVSVVRGGIVPTPAIGCLVPQLKASAGLMITASHNPASDNGVKAFGPDGFKLSTEQQDEIEALIQDTNAECFVDVAQMGIVSDQSELADRYVEFALSSVESGVSFKGLKIAIDAANGAARDLGHRIVTHLEGEIVASLGDTPDGANINKDCGAMHPERLQEAVKSSGADIGMAFDGDADRIILVDELGKVVDGDQVMGAIGLDYAARGLLKHNTVVATIMSNMGLELALEERGITLERTKVGDRYVVERMREGGFVVGGEQSGHIVLTDYVTTGDAIIAALQVLQIMVRKNQSASEVLSVFAPVPQVLKNIRYSSSDPLSASAVEAKLSDVKAGLGRSGRLVVRKSGTEPVIRVMAEALDAQDANQAVDDIIEAVLAADQASL